MLGIARFAYTSMIPAMEQGAGLTPDVAGWLAAINYAGYMLGAMIAMLLSDLQLKDRLFRIGLVVAIVSTLGMGLTEQVWLWSLFRFIAGLSSAAGLLICSGLIMNWLIRHHFKSELGVHFSGLGLGIVVSALAAQAMAGHLAWDDQWLLLGMLALLLALPAWRWIPRPDSAPDTIHGQRLVDRPPSAAFQWLLMAAYFCAGWGYVIHATFIVAIVERLHPGLGQWAFVLVGATAAPGVILWDVIAARIGVLNALLAAYLLQAIGIFLPLWSDAFAALVASALLYGFTFIGIVGLVLSMAGRFYPTRPARLMGRMTLSYGVAQIAAPAIAGMLAARSGDFRQGILSAGVFMLLGMALIALLKRFPDLKEW